MRLASALLLGFALLAPAQTPSKPAAATTPRRPKLIVALTVDQFRYDYLTRFRDQYTGGIAQMLNKGAVFTNAYYEHFPTVTAIGHSTFLSGATPSISGIIGNEWFDREANRQVTSVFDDKVSMLGGAPRGGSGAASPRRMMVSTVGDELKMAGRGSKVVGISVKDRSAILPAGHMADGAYWFDPTSGNFVSSTHYFPQLPGWAADFNKSRIADRFVGQQWTPLGGGAAFKTMPATPDKAYFNLIESTPYGNDLVVQFAQAAIAGEQMGRRNNVTDILAMSFSSNDYIGHAVGPDHPQVKDVSIRTDRLLGEFFQYLDKQIGMRNVLVIFTADHGVAPVPEVSQERKMPGGRIDAKLVADTVQKAIEARYGEGKWVEGKTGASLYLNQKLIQEKRLNPDEVAETGAVAARAIPHMFRAYTRYQMQNAAVPGDLIDRRMLNGFHQRRSPDINVVVEPYYLFEAKGTSHGMPFQYDAHIPLIFFGDWVKPGRYHFNVAANDIAPTLTTLLDVETPSGSVGRVLHEILQPTVPALAR
jgi:predicted AlkP superfamily pyrophosphatase or phosphodiesterase